MWKWYLKCHNCGYKIPISENDLPAGNFGKLNGRCSKCGKYKVECEPLFISDIKGGIKC